MIQQCVLARCVYADNEACDYRIMNSSANYFETKEKRPISTFITHQSGDQCVHAFNHLSTMNEHFSNMQHTTHDTDLDCSGIQDQQREALQKRHRYLPPITINRVNRFALHYYARAHTIDTQSDQP